MLMKCLCRFYNRVHRGETPSASVKFSFSCDSRNTPQTRSIRIISLGRTWTYHPRMGSQCSLSWHGQLDHLFLLFITSPRTVLCKSKSRMSMREPTVAVWSVGDAWNMSQMARICMGFEYFSDKSGLRYDTTNKQSSPLLLLTDLRDVEVLSCRKLVDSKSGGAQRCSWRSTFLFSGNPALTNLSLIIKHSWRP